MVYLNNRPQSTVNTTSYQGVPHSPGQAGVVSRQFQFIFIDPNVKIIVLSSPAPVLVGEPVDQVEVLDTHGGDATKQIFVGQQVLKLVHRYRHVSRLVRAGVEITVVLG